MGLPLLALCGLTLIGPPSPETVAFSIAVLVTVVGGFLAPWRKNATWGARAGFLLLLAIIGYRFVEAESSATITRTGSPPAPSSGRPRGSRRRG